MNDKIDIFKNKLLELEEKYKFIEEKTETPQEKWICDYCGKEFSSKKGKQYHENIHCQSNMSSSINKEILKSDTCNRCGRTGHYLNNCYASTHIKGYVIHKFNE